MAQPLTLVTGATGKTGAALVAELRARDMPVRALVHRIDARSNALAALGAEIVAADMFDPDQLLAALRGTQRAYYLPFFHPHVLQSAVAFAMAAREARVEAVVRMGQWLSHRAHPTILTRQTWLMDRLFAELPGTAHVLINPGMFADNFLRMIDFAALLGVFPWLAGRGRAAPVSNKDLARTAAAALIAPERYDGMSLRPTGPVLLSVPDMTAIMARVVGHRVRPIRIPPVLMLKVARAQGVSPMEIGGFLTYMQDMARDTFALDGGVTTVVEDMTGRPAEDFETIARRYAAQPFARQTLGNRIRALAAFMVAPLRPGYNLNRWARQASLPVPPNPSLSIDDPRWRDEHHHLMTRQQRPPVLREAAA